MPPWRPRLGEAQGSQVPFRTRKSLALRFRRDLRSSARPPGNETPHTCRARSGAGRSRVSRRGRSGQCGAALRPQATAGAQTHPLQACEGGARRPWRAARTRATGASAGSRTGRGGPGREAPCGQGESMAARSQGPAEGGGRAQRVPGTGGRLPSAPRRQAPHTAHLARRRRWSARRWPCRPRTSAASPGPRWPLRRGVEPLALCPRRGARLSIPPSPRPAPAPPPL